ncbi:MAG: biotin--[acetyl-CoA-carboxylase] ligase [Thermomicrobiales bacterium]|nr:biotin--[acetyl-CoA-carboxylase] ligase [Thermomicrobiales bacterium]
MGDDIRRYAQVASTMEIAADLAVAGASEGTVVLADEQTAGRGRAGRSWRTPPGSSLALTAILRPPLPPDRISTLPLVAGVAVAEAIEALTGTSVWLKWPNDCWLGDRNAGAKVAGVLMTARLAEAGVAFALLGIGINVTSPADALPPAATSLAAAGLVSGDPRESLLALLLERLTKGYTAALIHDGRPPLDAWRRRAALLGEPVTIDREGKPATGVFAGVRDDGALVLRRPDGTLLPIVAGDLTRGPRYDGRLGG